LIWFVGHANLEWLQRWTKTYAIRLEPVVVEPVDCIHDLSILLDSSLSMRQHIARVTSTCFILWWIRKLSCILDIDAGKQLVLHRLL